MEFHLIIQGTAGRDHAKVTALCAIAHIWMQPDLCLSTLLQQWQYCLPAIYGRIDHKVTEEFSETVIKDLSSGSSP